MRTDAGDKERAIGAWADDYAAWLVEAAAPLWAEKGIHPGGGFYEALSFAGAPAPADLARVRVQGRQISVFCAAHAWGWRPHAARRIIERGIRFMLAACQRPDGLFSHTVDLDAERPADAAADLYDIAFCLFALAHARPVLGQGVESEIEDILRALEHEMAAPAGGYRARLPGSDIRLQNPHMHLFEAAMTLHEHTEGRIGGPLMEALYRFCTGAFFENEDGWVKERTDPDGAALEQAFEPGHSFEWVWLLGWHARLTGRPPPAFQRRLYERAVASLDRSGRAPMKAGLDGGAIDSSCRLWSQIEALKAHLEMAGRDDPELAATALDAALESCERIRRDWLDPAELKGGWLDHFDADGRLIATAMPAGNGYHLVSAITELHRFARQTSKQ